MHLPATNSSRQANADGRTSSAHFRRQAVLTHLEARHRQTEWCNKIRNCYIRKRLFSQQAAAKATNVINSKHLELDSLRASHDTSEMAILVAILALSSFQCSSAKLGSERIDPLLLSYLLN